MAHILLVVAHPQMRQSRVNARLMREALCWKAPLVMPGAHRVSETEIDAHARRFCAELTAFGSATAAARFAGSPSTCVPADQRRAAP